jgi:hypothetical protein
MSRGSICVEARKNETNDHRQWSLMKGSNR